MYQNDSVQAFAGFRFVASLAAGLGYFFVKIVSLRIVILLLMVTCKLVQWSTINHQWWTHNSEEVQWHSRHKEGTCPSGWHLDWKFSRMTIALCKKDMIQTSAHDSQFNSILKPTSFIAVGVSLCPCGRGREPFLRRRLHALLQYWLWNWAPVMPVDDFHQQ